MAVQATGMLDPDDLNDTDCRLLDVLHDGRVTPQYAADQLDVSRTYSSERLKRLLEHNHVTRPAPGLYEITDDPRPGYEAVAKAELLDRLEALQERLDSTNAELENIGSAFERGDPDAAREALERAQEAISDGDLDDQ